MLPTKSNSSGSGCVPNSSDCIIWQGPNIPCINLCTGDSITDVTYKIAEKLCAVQSTFSLSSLQLGDLATFCTTIAGPPTGDNKTLLNVLDYIVKKLDCVNDKVDAIPAPTTPQQPNIELPVCLRYVSGGVPVNSLVHSAATLHIANEFCLLKSAVDTNTRDIAANTIKIIELEKTIKTGGQLPLVTPNCAHTNIPANVPVAMNLLLDVLEAEMCDIKKQVGSDNDISGATNLTTVTQLCPNTNNFDSSPALSRSGTMLGAYAPFGWNSPVTNLAESLQNLWITVLDMRCVINDLKACCGQVSCSDFTLDYTVTADVNRQTLTISFANTRLPSTGFSNGTGEEKPYIEITDGITTIKYSTFDFVSAVTNNLTVSIPVAGSTPHGGVPLNTALIYTIRMNATIVKDGKSCTKGPIEKKNNPPCPTVGLITVVPVPTS